MVLDHLGGRLGELSVPTSAKGYESLVCWAEGKCKREIVGCLRRYVAREVYRVLVPAASPVGP